MYLWTLNCVSCFLEVLITSIAVLVSSLKRGLGLGLGSFCGLVFRERWIYLCLFEEAGQSMWPQRHVRPLALQFLVFLGGAAQCIVNQVCLSQRWVITLRKERGEQMSGRWGRDGPKPDLPLWFLAAEKRLAVQSPGLYLRNNRAPHWGLLPWKRR